MEHGTWIKYRDGCRCSSCEKAGRDYNRTIYQSSTYFRRRGILPQDELPHSLKHHADFHVKERPIDCGICVRFGLAKPKCSLCLAEYDKSHGGQWCSDRCRWWSDVLVRGKDGLYIKSLEAWEAFSLAYYKKATPPPVGCFPIRRKNQSGMVIYSSQLERI